MSEKLFDMKPIRWNSPSSCCCDRTAPVAKLDASHSRWKGPDLDGKASLGVEVTVLFSTSKACCSAAPHDQSFDFRVSIVDREKLRAMLLINPTKSTLLPILNQREVGPKTQGRPPVSGSTGNR